MDRKNGSVDYFPINPLTLRCPLCDAKAGKDCQTLAKVRLVVVHVARVRAAAKMDQEAKKT
jgi:hypothetical protein